MVTSNTDVIEVFLNKSRTSVSVMINSVRRQKRICVFGKKKKIVQQSTVHLFVCQSSTLICNHYFITQSNKIKFKRLHTKELPSDSLLVRFICKAKPFWYKQLALRGLQCK